MQLLAGTSGYSYKEWLGHFYPEKLPANAMLRFYAQHFTTVEINNTFYRMPAEAMLHHWCEEVPEGFTFTLKAPRRITHEKRLREAESDVAEFVRRAQVLGSRLGPLLFQLPHYFRKDLARLKDFLGLVPPGSRTAFDFRNDTWLSDDVYDALRARGAMLCVTDNEQGETPFVTTTDCGYLRLRRTHYDEAELAQWVGRIAPMPLRFTYVYFMHEDEALGTRFARIMNESWQRTATRSKR
jgi:uncharacterized protein YecE (DUF72 family)